MSTRVLVIDNYDSFVYTLVGYLQELGATTTVIRNDDLTAEQAVALAAEHDGVLISPGPGAPAQAGVSEPLIRDAVDVGRPLLGVCLGHQALGEVHAARVGRSAALMHGKTSSVEHDGTGVFAGVPSPFTATRYHSLTVAPGTVPESLRVTARSDDGEIMGLAHRTAPVHSVQFHPESVLTGHGHLMLGNWLELCGLTGAAEAARELSPLIASAR